MGTKLSQGMAPKCVCFDIHACAKQEVPAHLCMPVRRKLLRALAWFAVLTECGKLLPRLECRWCPMHSVTIEASYRSWLSNEVNLQHAEKASAACCTQMGVVTCLSTVVCIDFSGGVARML